MSGHAWQSQFQALTTHRERYAHPQCRAYFDPVTGASKLNYWKDSRSTWLKLWINWSQLRPTSLPTDVYEYWRQLNNSNRIQELDREIVQANADGIGVILTVYHEYPYWATGRPDLDSRAAPVKSKLQKAPESVDANSAYGWFILWLLARYRYGAGTNGTKRTDGLSGRYDGPNETKQLGNPWGAWIMALEPVNEPNLNMWTHWDAPARRDVHLKAAGMMKTAHFWSQKVATWTNPPLAYPTYVLGPATSDSAEQGAPWDTFTTDVLNALSGWPPKQVAGASVVPYVGWSHHNYQDVEDEWTNTWPPGGATRVENLRNLLYLGGWKSVNGGNKYIWLTEGGFKLPDQYSTFPAGDKSAWQSIQANTVKQGYAKMLPLPDVYMWANHGIDDLVTDTFKTHLRDDYDLAAPNGGKPGPQRLLFNSWLDNTQLPAATTA